MGRAVLPTTLVFCCPLPAGLSAKQLAASIDSVAGATMSVTWAAAAEHLPLVVERQASAGGRVRVDGTAHDQHGRLLGTLWLDDRNLNRELVAEGHAWVFGGFAPDPDLVAAETSARSAHRGLWADAKPVEPSQWRSEHPSHR